MISEKKLESIFSKKVKEKGAITFKLIPSQVSGLPDRIVITKKGKIFFVEIKKINGVLSKQQIQTHKELRPNNVNVYTLYKQEDIDTIVTML